MVAVGQYHPGELEPDPCDHRCPSCLLDDPIVEELDRLEAVVRDERRRRIDQLEHLAVLVVEHRIEEKFLWTFLHGISAAGERVYRDTWYFAEWRPFEVDSSKYQWEVLATDLRLRAEELRTIGIAPGMSLPQMIPDGSPA
jgi:hypothetical protein